MLPDTNAFARSLERGLSGTAAFVYANSHLIALISLAWAFTSVFIVTIGPATLGAYVALLGLNSDRNRIELDRVLSICRQQFVPATAFGLLPLLFFGLSGAYVYSIANDMSMFRLVAAILTFYIGLYLSLVMIPTFVALAHGRPGAESLRAGVRWVAAKPTVAMMTGLITLAIFLITTALTVAFVLLFAGIAFSVHIRMVGDDVVPAGERYPDSS